jgi:pyruvate/2-oxoglutarate dehydrogenase complex dihydrolipoamide dehydrogenase (E3) component
VTIDGLVGVDMRAVKARKDAVVAASRNGVERSLKTLKGCTVYEGHGRFVANKKVAVNGIDSVPTASSSMWVGERRSPRSRAWTRFLTSPIAR